MSALAFGFSHVYLDTLLRLKLGLLALLGRLRALLASKLAQGEDASAFARLLAMQLDGSAIHRLAFGGDGEIDAAWRLLVDLARQKEKPQ